MSSTYLHRRASKKQKLLYLLGRLIIGLNGLCVLFTWAAIETNHANPNFQYPAIFGILPFICMLFGYLIKKSVQADHWWNTGDIPHKW